MTSSARSFLRRKEEEQGHPGCIRPLGSRAKAVTGGPKREGEVSARHGVRGGGYLLLA